MVDYMTQNSVYIVMLVVLVIWLGIYLYLFRIDRRIRKLEKGTEK